MGSIVLTRPTSAGGGGEEPTGGETITDPNVAYIRTDGNDTTGDGSPGAPFLTWQKAIDAGFKVFDFGVGSFGDADFTEASAPHNYSVRGRGVTKTLLGTVEAAGLTAIGLRLRDVTLTTVNASAAVDGAPGGQIALSLGGSSVTVLSSSGGAAEENGGEGGHIIVDGPGVVQVIAAPGGDGGSGNGQPGLIEVNFAAVSVYPTDGSFSGRFVIVESIPYVEIAP